MDFIEIKVTCHKDFSEILMAELSEIGFNSFVEDKDGFNAYVEEGAFENEALQDVYNRYIHAAQFIYQLNKIEKQNWNEEWEKNYSPIVVDGQCIVKASFHQIPEPYPYEITINPKMSFGTGHHATTWLMMKQQLELDFNGKSVLDAGCGTCILGILASYKGAKEVDACDIDEWPVENSLENVELNGRKNIKVYLGTVNQLPEPKKYDIILANINRNVLLEEIVSYASLQAPQGYLLLSGFYEEDIKEIEKECLLQGYKLLNNMAKDKWACCCFQLA